MKEKNARGPLLPSIVMVLMATVATGLLAVIGFQALPDSVIPSTFSGNERESRQVNVSNSPSDPGRAPAARPSPVFTPPPGSTAPAQPFVTTQPRPPVGTVPGARPTPQGYRPSATTDAPRPVKTTTPPKKTTAPSPTATKTTPPPPTATTHAPTAAPTCGTGRKPKCESAPASAEPRTASSYSPDSDAGGTEPASEKKRAGKAKPAKDTKATPARSGKAKSGKRSK